MYRVPRRNKHDPGQRWALPDRVFFACGACHILVFAFVHNAMPRAERFVARFAAPAQGRHHAAA
jgi:hypothetical protein